MAGIERKMSRSSMSSTSDYGQDRLIDLINMCSQTDQGKTQVQNWIKHMKNHEYGRRTGKLVSFTTDLDKLFPSSSESENDLDTSHQEGNNNNELLEQLKSDKNIVNTIVNNANLSTTNNSPNTSIESHSLVGIKMPNEDVHVTAASAHKLSIADISCNSSPNSDILKVSDGDDYVSLQVSRSKLTLGGTNNGSFTEKDSIKSSLTKYGTKSHFKKDWQLKKRLTFSELAGYQESHIGNEQPKKHCSKSFSGMSQANNRPMPINLAASVNKIPQYGSLSDMHSESDSSDSFDDEFLVVPQTVKAKTHKVEKKNSKPNKPVSVNRKQVANNSRVFDQNDTKQLPNKEHDMKDFQTPVTNEQPKEVMPSTSMQQSGYRRGNSHYKETSTAHRTNQNSQRRDVAQSHSESKTTDKEYGERKNNGTEHIAHIPLPTQGDAVTFKPSSTRSNQCVSDTTTFQTSEHSLKHWLNTSESDLLAVPSNLATVNTSKSKRTKKMVSNFKKKKRKMQKKEKNTKKHLVTENTIDDRTDAKVIDTPLPNTNTDSVHPWKLHYLSSIMASGPIKKRNVYHDMEEAVIQVENTPNAKAFPSVNESTITNLCDSCVPKDQLIGPPASTPRLAPHRPMINKSHKTKPTLSDISFGSKIDYFEPYPVDITGREIKQNNSKFSSKKNRTRQSKRYKYGKREKKKSPTPKISVLEDKNMSSFESRVGVLSPPKLIVREPSPEAVARGLRRSTRARVRPLRTWFGERLVYGDNDTLIGVGTTETMMEPVISTTVNQTQERKAAKRKKEAAQKPPATKGKHKTLVPEKTSESSKLQTSKTVNNIDEVHFVADDGFSEEQDMLTSGTEFKNALVKIQDQGSQIDVRASTLFSIPEVEIPFDNNGQRWKEGDPVKFTKGLSNDLYSMGRVNLQPRQEKGLTSMRKDSVCFFVSVGTVEVTLGSGIALLASGSYFHVPPGNLYNIKNQSTTSTAELTYVQIKFRD
ncbi:unnamed protein product [Clavelina lepadiformis]|uniref:Mif2/CENP-C cupin domain-containing protein n=1 Tax=Clavelina lepadiformis TaxID=159417 RepID=A0ABP0FYU2_CLALP